MGNYKFLLFAFDSYESLGGMDDLVFKFNTFEELVKNYEYKDLYNYQLVFTSDFSFKEFNTSITHRVGVDDYNEIKKTRKEELFNWISLQIIDK